MINEILLWCNNDIIMSKINESQYNDDWRIINDYYY